MQGPGKVDRQTVWVPDCGLEKRDFEKPEDENGTAGHKTILVRNIQNRRGGWCEKATEKMSWKQISIYLKGSWEVSLLVFIISRQYFRTVIFYGCLEIHF